MTSDDFINGMRELSDVFGSKWPKPITDRLWIQVRDIDGRAFRNIMTGLSFNSTKHPSAGDIVTACQSLIRTAREQRRQGEIDAMNAKGMCPDCENSGVIFAEIAGKPHEYMFRCCKCRAADIRSISTQVPPWDTYRRNKYRIRNYSAPVASKNASMAFKELNAIVADWNEVQKLADADVAKLEVPF